MMHLNRFQNLIIRLCRIKPFNVNEALKQQWRNGKQRGLLEGRMEKADCKVCPLWQADRRRLIGAYEQPSPTTYGKIAAQGPKITRQLQPVRIIPNPHGRYFHERHKEYLKTSQQPAITLEENDDWLR